MRLYISIYSESGTHGDTSSGGFLTPHRREQNRMNLREAWYAMSVGSFRNHANE